MMMVHHVVTITVTVTSIGVKLSLDCPTDPKERRIGNAQQEIIRQALISLAIFPFTRRLGLTIDEVHALVAGACIDAANPDLKAYFPL